MNRMLPMTKNEIIERLDQRTYKDPNSGCWIWEGSLTHKGYASCGYTLFKEFSTGHRLTYFLYRGQIPKSLVVDHLCRVRCCINPWHLELVTAVENTKRGIIIPDQTRNGRKTHCIYGHEFNEKNTYHHTDSATGNPARTCRVCQMLYQRRRRERLKLECD